MPHIHCMKCNQSDFKILTFRLKIYIILIHLLQRPYFDIVVLKKEHSKMKWVCKLFAD